MIKIQNCIYNLAVFGIIVAAKLLRFQMVFNLLRSYLKSQLVFLVYLVHIFIVVKMSFLLLF